VVEGMTANPYPGIDRVDRYTIGGDHRLPGSIGSAHICGHCCSAPVADMQADGAGASRLNPMGLSRDFREIKSA
jgi:hypothetical protein